MNKAKLKQEIKAIIKESFLNDCGLDNEGAMGDVVVKENGVETKIVIYNDGYECCAMIKGKYLVGVKLQEC